MPELPIPKIDEFAFVLMGGVLMILLLMILWTTPTESLPQFTPTSVELSLRQGSSKSFDLAFNGTFSGVNLTASGDIKDWLSFSKQNFNILNTGKATITIKVPGTKAAGRYNGKIAVQSLGGTNYVDVFIEVVKKTTEIKSKPIVLGDFSVSYSKGTEILDSKENVMVTKSYFSESSLALLGTISDARLPIVTDALVQLDIVDTNGAGNLIVIVNGKKAFDSVASMGKLVVPVDKGMLQASNVVEIKAGSPGWMFWASTAYKLQSASFSTNYEGIFSKSFDFTLDANQAENFKSLGLSYRVRDYNTPISELVIRVNNQLVLWERPPLAVGNYTFTKDMFGNDLLLSEGDNTISFSFEKEASYSMADATLTVNYYSQV